jgi:hypothetical protein
MANINLETLPSYAASHGGSMEAAFQNMHESPKNLLIKQALIAIAKCIDNNKTHIIVLPSEDSKLPGVVLQVLRGPLAASSCFSYTGGGEGEGEDDSHSSVGPIVPVKFTNQGNFHLALAMRMIIMTSPDDAMEFLTVEGGSAVISKCFFCYIDIYVLIYLYHISNICI